MDPGLSSAEVAERRARGEVNRVRDSDWVQYLDIILRNLFTLFNGLVLPAAIALFFLDKTKESLGVSGMALTNTILGLIQELRAKRHLDRLALLTETRARVVRDGKVQEIGSGDIVRGDHVLLRAGDPVLADGTVLEAGFLEVDEALLTGESDPVTRKVGESLLSGSYCVAGEGRYRADRVGKDSFAQQTTKEAREYHHVASALQVGVNWILQILTAAAILLCLLYGVLYWWSPFGLDNLFEMIAATVTSMVPSGLVLMVTLAFILGAIRMSSRGALVQRLNAVESMAAVDILCLDKTGTLTTGNLQVDRILPLDGRSEEEARAVLRDFASGTGDGNKSVQALRAELESVPVEVSDRLPFKSQNRYSAIRAGDRVLVLGAAEAVGPLCESDSWRKPWETLIPTGLRLLLIAETRTPPRARFEGSLEGYRLTPVGVVALRDELRPEAGEVLQSLAEQGIAFKIISGDNPETVRATVAPLGQSDHPALRALVEQEVVTGAELERAPVPGELMTNRSVFGRVAPRQKLQIVRYLQGLGHRVGMLGDGVNDVLPIKNATLGIAMGDGSPATKTVSGLVLETNDFRLLPATLEEGRTILRNLRRACKLFLVKNLFTLVLILGILGLFGPPAFPFKPLQVTLLNILTIGIPALLVIANRDPARVRKSGGFVPEVLSFVLRTGLIIGGAGLVLAQGVGPVDESRMQTLLLGLLILLGAANLWRLLSDGEPLGSVGRGDRILQALALLGPVIYLGAVYVPLTQWLFDLVPLTGADLVLLGMAGLCALVLLLLADRFTEKNVVRK